MTTESLTALFNEKKSRHNIEFELKPEQMKIASAIHGGSHCLGFLPTGFGKTLSFVINTILSDNPTITLIVSPLLSLMDNQIHSLGQWNLKAAKIAANTPVDVQTGIANGEYSVVFCSPESILKPKWRSILLSDIWQKRVSCIVFDEVHCLSEWGEDFRPEYKEMAQLRSFFRVPVLAVTATSTLKVKDDVISFLQLEEDKTLVVSISADRPNIFISCQKKTSNDYETELSWLIEHIKDNGINSKKTIIYCRSIDTVSELFISLKDALGDNAYMDKTPDVDHLLIEMYHKCTHETSKQRILDKFSKANSVIRCIVATVALGMGIDIPDVRLIVHIGCPKSIISYWQEAGRCARDGQQGFSMILYDNFTASLKTTDKAMSKLVKNADDQCLRKQIIDVFSVHGNASPIQEQPCEGCDAPVCSCAYCRCCSSCVKKCKCLARADTDVRVFLKN